VGAARPLRVLLALAVVHQNQPPLPLQVPRVRCGVCGALIDVHTQQCVCVCACPYTYTHIIFTSQAALSTPTPPQQTNTPPHQPTTHSDIDEEVRLDPKRVNVGGALFLLPEDCVDLQEFWKAFRQFQLHPRVDPAKSQSPKPPLRAEGGAYGVDAWTNVAPHLKTFSRSLPPPYSSSSFTAAASAAAAAAATAASSPGPAGGGGGDDDGADGGEPLAWLWLTSANLSAGALGFKGVLRNFEAGVLFHSHTSSSSSGSGGGEGNGIVYRAWPTKQEGSTPTPPPPPPAGWPAETRTVFLPLPYRLDGAPYTEQDEEDPTPDLLVPPYFHSHHDLRHQARLRGLEPQIEAVFARVGEDLRELERVHGLDARGRPLRRLMTQPLVAVDGNVGAERGAGEEGERGGKRLKATI
jgi:hypothetical protein